MKPIRGKGPRMLKFDCPWEGHLLDDRFVLRNSSAPNVIGHRCVKCMCLIYIVMELSQVVSADGRPLANA